MLERLEDRKLLTSLPTISDIVDRTTLESTATPTIAFVVGDVETPAASLVVTGVSSNTALVPNANIVFGGSGANRTVSISPAPGLSGIATIQITVTDSDFLSATDTFVLTVTPVYSLPAESIPDLVMNADGTLTLQFQMGNSAWTPSVTRTNESLFRSVGTSSTHDLRLQGSGINRSLRIRPAPGLYGESNISLIITGDSGGPTTTQFKVTVNPRAVADNLLGVAGKTSTFNLLRNDTVPRLGSSAVIASFTQPANGTLVVGVVPGTLRYTPNQGYLGEDLFTYTVLYDSTIAVTSKGYITVASYTNLDAVHADIRFDYEAGVWTNEIHGDIPFGTPNQGGGSNPTILDFDESLLMVNPASIITLPPNLNTELFQFLGRGPNEPIWNLPQAQRPDVLWPGINTESIAAGTLASYAPTGDPRATANARWLRVDMVDFRIPSGAVFSASQSGTIPIVFFDSIDGANGPNETAIGNNVSDTFWITENTHAHMNWFFTHPGRYEIDLRAKGFIDQGGGNLVEVISPVNTLHFMVYGENDPSTTGPLTEAAPTLRSDSVGLLENSGPVTINVLSNDQSSPDALEHLTVTNVTQATNGSVIIAMDGQSVVYQPHVDFHGVDSFVYTVTDEHGGIATSMVTVTVSSVLTIDQSNPSGTVLSLFSNSGTWTNSPNGSVLLSASIGSIVKNADGTWNWTYVPTEKQENQAITITYNDGVNIATKTFTIDATVAVFQRGVMYVGATGTSAQSSLATDKRPLLPGQDSTFANYTNYVRGLNGLVVDVAGLPSTTTEAQLLSSIQFARWDGIAATGFSSLPVAAVPTVSILMGQGMTGSTRVRITFPDNTLQNTWLRVTVLANALTGLDSNDLFYFGNVIGDVGAGNTASRLRVNATDTGAVRSNQSTANNSANVDNIYDLNRDGRVNATDTGIVRSNQQTAGIVAPLRAPSMSPPPILPAGLFAPSQPGTPGISTMANLTLASSAAPHPIGTTSDNIPPAVRAGGSRSSVAKVAIIQGIVLPLTPVGSPVFANLVVNNTLEKGVALNAPMALRMAYGDTHLKTDLSLTAALQRDRLFATWISE